MSPVGPSTQLRHGAWLLLSCTSLLVGCASRDEASESTKTTRRPTTAPSATTRPARPAPSPTIHSDEKPASPRLPRPPGEAGPEVGSGPPPAMPSPIPTEERDRDRSESQLAAVAELPGHPLEGESVAEVVRTNMGRFTRCLPDRVGTTASVDLRLQLSGGGVVVGAEAIRSRPDDPRLRDCVIEAARELSFRRDPGSGISTVVFQLVLSTPAR